VSVSLSRPTTLPSPRVRIWTVTLGLVAAAALGIGVLLATGAPRPFVAVGVVALVAVSVASWRSGGRFELSLRESRPLGPEDPPEIRRALLAVCEAAGRPVPGVVIVQLDAPGAMVGYDDGEPVIGVDPLLHRVVSDDGLRALFAHELGHLGTDIHTDAIREHLPSLLGFVAFWTALLAGRGPAIATAGTGAFLALVVVPDGRLAGLVSLRYALGLGVEPLALAASRYANRQEEYRADALGARLVSPAAMTEALYRIAAIATGDNDEDVTGPVPWDADRSLRFAAFATHPSIESRARALGCDLPAWVRPYRPHADRPIDVDPDRTPRRSVDRDATRDGQRP
jgi:Zn-dependent protease with chaperone function